MATLVPSSNSSAASSPAPAGSSPQFAGVGLNENIVYWLDVGLFGIIGVFFLAALPRSIGRYSNLTEWTRGLLLRAGSSSFIQPSRPTTGITPIYPSNSNGTVESDLSPTLANHVRYPAAPAMRSSGPPSSPPWHIPSLATMLYPISTFFSLSITPGKTFGKVALSLIYIAGILFVVFYSSDPLAAPARLGDISVSQIPFVVALGTKNNIIGTLLSKGYERVRKFCNFNVLEHYIDRLPA